ncbi:MAG: hypothetical protein HYU31_02300, partial [Deltaproteobacteria bacterium]|nr:hypothetical protein [Deltaproteobacteria bacterium]
MAAALLKQAGLNVFGAHMICWDDCDWKEERRDALRVALQLGIPFSSFDFRDGYRERVFDYMIREYAEGKTPNPDVMCNREIKFDLFVEKAKELRIDYIATGHYARLNHDGTRPVLSEALDKSKDQSYFLWAVEPRQLSRCLFPLGDYTKEEVRQIARSLSLPTAEKKDPLASSDPAAVVWHRLDFDVEPGISYRVTYQSKKEKRGFHPEREWVHVPTRKALEADAAETIIKMNAITDRFESAGANDATRMEAYHRVLTRLGTWRTPFFWCEEEASRNVLDNQFSRGVERSRRRSLHDLVGSRGAGRMLELLKKKLAPPAAEGGQPTIELAPEVPDLIRALAMSGDKPSLEVAEDFLVKLAPVTISSGPPMVAFWWEALEQYARFLPQRIASLGKSLEADPFAAKFLAA